VRPESNDRPDDQNYSESDSVNPAAVRHDRQRANQAAANGLARLGQPESPTRTPYGTAPGFEPEAPTAGNGMQWCPKCGKSAIPIGEPSCGEYEPCRTLQPGELSYQDLVNEVVRLRARVRELAARAANPQRKSKPVKPEPNSDEERVMLRHRGFLPRWIKTFISLRGLIHARFQDRKGLTASKYPGPHLPMLTRRFASKTA
jgi:hypothetical protein